MLYLILSIFSSTILLLLFKIFENTGIKSFQAIVVNYLVASIFGFTLSENFNVNDITNSGWFYNTILLGLMFIVLFNLMALTTQKSGISVSSVANKMSVIIPIAFSFYLYNDKITFLKIAGILIALIGVYMASLKQNDTSNKKYLIYPILLFIGSGFLDTYIKYSQNTFVSDNEVNLFVPTIFTVSTIIGVCALSGKMIFFGEKLDSKSIIGGIVLGIVNYSSIYFFIKTLGIKEIESSIVFPLNNMGIVVTSSITSFIFFNENMSKQNWIGIILSVVAIGLIFFGI